MTQTQEGTSHDMPIPLIALLVAATLLALFGGLLFDGLALFWCRLVTSGILVAYLAPYAMRSIRQARTPKQGGNADEQDARSGSGTVRRRIANVGEAILQTLVVVVAAYTCVMCCMDLPRLSSPEVAHLSGVSCGMGRRGAIITLSGTDVGTGEEVGFWASRRNMRAYDESREDAGTYAQVIATVEYLPSSRVVVSADFYSYEIPESFDLSGSDYSGLAYGYEVIRDLLDSSS